MSKFGLIGGTGLTTLDGLQVVKREVVNTPYGEPSGPIAHGRLSGTSVSFLARHGAGHTIPPHQVNYRANIWALRHVGVEAVIAVNAVGGIHPDLIPGQLLIPDQIIDYTFGRGHTFFERELTRVVHVDFSFPYSERLRRAMWDAGRAVDLPIREAGIYGVTQGPRLESAAEIDRMERDGCDVVGMTGMPEAGLARELGLEYAACTVVVNRAAGRGEGVITAAEIEANLAVGMGYARILLEAVIPAL